MNPIRLATHAFAALCLWAPIAGADVPASIAAPDQTLMATYHAEGAQYECKADAAGKLAW